MAVLKGNEIQMFVKIEAAVVWKCYEKAASSPPEE